MGDDGDSDASNITAKTFVADNDEDDEIEDESRHTSGYWADKLMEYLDESSHSDLVDLDEMDAMCDNYKVKKAEEVGLAAKDVSKLNAQQIKPVNDAWNKYYAMKSAEREELASKEKMGREEEAENERMGLALQQKIQSKDKNKKKKQMKKVVNNKKGRKRKRGNGIPDKRVKKKTKWSKKTSNAEKLLAQKRDIPSSLFDDNDPKGRDDLLKSMMKHRRRKTTKSKIKSKSVETLNGLGISPMSEGDSSESDSDASEPSSPSSSEFSDENSNDDKEQLEYDDANRKSDKKSQKQKDLCSFGKRFRQLLRYEGHHSPTVSA